MAERRMFAKSIVMSDAFLDMPMSARCLYFTLGMVADDDGFVGSPKTTMRMCGSSIDDLNILLAKRYILGFKSGVVVIKHWKINNYIQNDRHKDTTYVEEKDTLTFDQKGSYTEKNKVHSEDFLPSETAPKTQCIQNGYTLETQNRIGKDRLDYISTSSKDSVLVGTNDADSLFAEDQEEKNSGKETVPYRQIVSYWNKVTAGRLPQVDKLPNPRKALIRQRWADYKSDVYMAIDKCVASDFLSGRNGKWDGCSFDWVFKASNMPKILEGNYDNKSESAPKHKDYSDIGKQNADGFDWGVK